MPRLVFLFFILFIESISFAKNGLEFRGGKSLSGTLKTQNSLPYSSIPLGINYFQLFSDNGGSGISFKFNFDQASYSTGNAIKNGWNYTAALGYMFRTDMVDIYIDTSLYYLGFNWLLSSSSEKTSVNQQVVQHASVVSMQGFSGFELEVKFGSDFTEGMFSKKNALIIAVSICLKQQNFSTLASKSVNSKGETNSTSDKINYQLLTTYVTLNLGITF